MSLFKEFKKFAFRGNVIDLATGVIIGAAFGKITTSLVDDIIMPPLGLLIANIDFTRLAFVLKPAVTNAVGEVTEPAVLIRYGNFIQIIVNFFIIAIAVFLFLEFIERLQRKEEEKPGPTPKPKPTEQEKLLAEIRDLLRDGADPQTAVAPKTDPANPA
ncbi:large conductance mechanosensitive channel [Catalinimonas alkaloidigena]|uniref:Large-conductance mechanosensitive channel n=1 Tax=Catalinimonas alkaloidigena TaxID=1075417 RepID=A0A1G9N671_9BACT|nr:large-conductance mechanosensitive channel protein MscL [Catalinimonas alkaloidigena]SDL81781.1 large conductance mechanosensitive channel [Catalinimonas alkaloidigena]